MIKYNNDVFFRRGIQLISSVLVFVLASLTVQGQDKRITGEESAFADLNIDHSSAVPTALQKVVSVSYNQTALQEVLLNLAKKAGYQLSYSDQMVPLGRPVSINMQNVSINNALWKVLDGTGLQFALSPNKHLVLMKGTGLAEQVKAESISGTVTDAQTGETLPGVNILVKGTSTGASTNAQGAYELIVGSLQDTLVVSFVGYQTQEVPIKGRATVNIQLQSQTIQGEEMVVVGYGEQQKENLTGSVSQVGSEDIELQPVNNATQALQGLAPGLNISVNQSGGASDATMDINIRGIGSLSTSKPYILIDGVRATQAEFSALNPSDIESVTVLKDAAAAAIYGSHAAYGVILVETKKSAKNQDFTLEYSNNFRFSQLINVPSTVSSIEYAKVGNDASRNTGGQKLFSEEQIAKMDAFIKGDLQYGTAQDPNNPNWWAGIEDGGSGGWASGFANTNWWDVMFKDTKLTQKHNISFRGGSNNLTYYISGDYLNDPGQFKYGDKNESYSKYNLNSNITADITNWLKISSLSRFSTTNNSFPNSLSGEGQRWRIYHDIGRMPPLAPYNTPPVKDNQGNINVPAQLSQVASWYENNGFNKNRVDNLVSTLKAELTIANYFSFKGDFTFKRRVYNNTFNYKKWQFMGPTGTTAITYHMNNNQIKRGYRKTDYTSFNIYANYDQTFWSDHNFKIVMGYQQEENNFDGLEVGRRNVLVDKLNSLNITTGSIIGPTNPMSSWSTMGAFGRFQYNYNQKYLLEFNGRYDGSSRFAPGKRFVFSPSVSAGYNIHKENFWTSLKKYINRFKLRASWGKLGNQEVSNYLYLASIPVQSRLPWLIGGERPNYTGMPNIISPNITWETSTTKNIGADLAFLNNRLSASVDVYERNTDNMFAPSKTLPAVLGTSPPETNSASLRTRGWELTVGWKDQISSDFSYNIKLMASDNQSTITAYNNPNKVISEYYVGQKLGEIWGYKTDGLFQQEKEVKNYLSKVDISYLGTDWQPGDVKYKDLNGDGKINTGDNTANNPGDRRVIGNTHPRYQFSISTGASWKNFSFNMLWRGVGKRDVWLESPRSFNFWGWNRIPFTHLTKENLDYWSEDNRDAYFPRPLAEDGRAGYSKNRHPSNRYLQNAAYIRLKSLNLSYSLPSFLTQKINVKNLRMFINGQNLFTITNIFPGLDPAMSAVEGGIYSQPSGGGRSYPLSRVYGLGIDISF